MTDEKRYLTLEKLEVYQLARKLSRLAWSMHGSFTWQIQKVIGDQFLRATDSVGANVAEGYGRYHYLDKIKFYYNARASLVESLHWFQLILERGLITEKNTITQYTEIHSQLSPKLNGLIKSTYSQKSKSSLLVTNYKLRQL